MGTQSTASKASRPGAIVVTVLDGRGIRAIASNAKVSLCTAGDLKDRAYFDARIWKPSDADHVSTKRTDREGRVTFDGLKEGLYVVCYGHYPVTLPQCVPVRAGCVEDLCFELDLDLQACPRFLDRDCKPIPCAQPRVGDVIELEITGKNLENAVLTPPPGFRTDPANRFKLSGPVLKTGSQTYPTTGSFPEIGAPAGATGASNLAQVQIPFTAEANEPPVVRIDGNVGATLSRTATALTDDLPFWQAILNSTEKLSFNHYLRFMNMLFCGENDLSDLPQFEQTRFGQKTGRYTTDLRPNRLLPFTDADAYRVVKAATEAFVMVNCGILANPGRPFDQARDEAYFARRDLPVPSGGLELAFDEDYLVRIMGGEPGEKTLPYLAVIRGKLPDIAIKLTPFELAPEQFSACHGILQEKLANPCLLELIWSYWHEEGMLAQTMKAITRRFQNVRGPDARDPLANLEIDPLRPLNNVLWGYVQDEQHRLSVVRRNYEYDHHYGLRLEGKAVRDVRAADTRSKFLEAFHNLLRLCAGFFKQDDDTTVKADAFPVLNALKEVHLIVSQAAHNQFGDLPSTARIEMLMEEWLLARPEFREFLPTRIMVAYPEPWMDRVDAMKKLQGWTDTSVLHFRNLAIFGEQVLLSIRYGNWSDVQEPLQALNWVRFFRPQIQGYTHAYRAATGVDLAAETVDSKVDATLPSVLLKRRLAMEKQAS